MFWIHASSAARFDQDVTDIVNQLQLSGRTAACSDSLALLESWLRGNSERRWLIILDNVDDAQFLVDPSTNRRGHSSRPRKSYLPHCDHGSVLITSRNKTAALQMVNIKSLRAVQSLASKDAIELLEKRLDIPSSREELALVAEALSCMPLALTQAAAYINHRSFECSVTRYLARLNLSKTDRKYPLACEEGDIYRDPEAQRSIILAWETSFDHISQTRPSAANLLFLMSFFDRQAIQGFLLQTERTRPVSTQQHSTSNVAKLTPQASNECFEQIKTTVDDFSGDDDRVEWERPVIHQCEFADDMKTLIDFSFVSPTTDADVFEMHRLVQDASQYWLSKRPELLERLKAAFIDILVQRFPRTPDLSASWPMCRLLYPHVKAAIEIKPQDHNSIAGLGRLLGHCGSFASWQTKWKDCESMLRLCLDLHDRAGVDGESLWMLRSNLAYCKSQLGLWDEALSIRKRISDMDAEQFGHNHRRTLDNQLGIAGVYFHQNRFADAERTLLDTLRAWGNSLGARNETTMECECLLATTYTAMGKYAKAETLLRDVMQACTDVPDLPRWLQAVALKLLAEVLRRMGRLAESEKVFEQALKTYVELLGQEHPFTLTIKRKLGLYQSAIDIMSECVLLSESSLGMDHPDTIKGRNTLSEWKES